MKHTIRITPLKIGIVLLLIYAFFIGLFTRYMPDVLQLAFLMLALFCIIVGKKSIKKKQAAMPVLSLFCMLIILLNRNARFLQGAVSLDLGILIALMAFFFLCDTDKWFACYSKTMIYLGIFYAATTIFLFLFPSVYTRFVAPLFYGNAMQYGIRLAEGGYAVGFSSHYSTTAIYLAVTISIPIVVLFRKDIVQEHMKKYALLLTALLFVSVLLTGKRAHSVFILFSGIVAYYFLNREKKLKRVFYLFGGVCALLVVFIIAAQFFPALLNILTRFQMTMERGDITSGRGELYQECFEMFQSNPLFGTGWGSYTYYTRSTLLSAHNVYFQLLAENGILLSIPFFCFIFGNYSHVVKVSSKANIFVQNNQKAELAMLASALFTQTFFILYCLTGNPLYDFQMFFPYILSCAIGEYFYKKVYR